MSHYIMLWKYSMNYKEAYSGVSTAWYRWFAWHPVDTADRGWRWLVPVWRRRCSKPEMLPGPSVRWFQHAVDIGVKTCRVEVQWRGLFVGRRHCLTHDVKWDSRLPCPQSSPAGRMRVRMSP